MLSTYIFVLCIERLFLLISIAMDQGVQRHIHLSRHGPPITYLAFAYDVILFVEAILEHVHVMKNILNLFCKSSRQKLSLEKSRMLFLNIVGRNLKQHLSDAIGMQWTEDLGNYLVSQIFIKGPHELPSSLLQTKFTGV